MTITITENASPFFVRFTHDGAEEIADICREVLANNTGTIYTQYVENLDAHIDWFPNDLGEYENDLIIVKLPEEAIDRIIALMPWKNDVFDFKAGVIFIMRSGPGWQQIIHKDRSNFGLNYFFEIADDKCITTFYDEEDINKANKVERLESLNAADLSNPEVAKREVNPRRFTNGIDPKTLTPTKTFIAKKGDVMILNTDLYHTWHNDSPHPRFALGLRLSTPYLQVGFEEAITKMLGDAL